MISDDTVRLIISMGFDVYVPTTGLTTYLFYTDGKQIAYLQLDQLRGYCTYTVHVPNRNCGTGFGIGEFISLTKAELEAAFCIAPNWASNADFQAVVKYPDVETWLKAQRIITYEKWSK